MHRSVTNIRQNPRRRLGLTLVLALAPVFGTWGSFGANIQIRDLEDIDFGMVPATVGDMRADASFCVAMQPRGRYSIVGTGEGPAGEFSILETGTGIHSINYSVRIADRGARRGRRLRPNIPLGNLRASRQQPSGRCNPRARIQVLIRGEDIAGAHPGRYEGTLSLMVEPE